MMSFSGLGEGVGDGEVAGDGDVLGDGEVVGDGDVVGLGDSPGVAAAIDGLAPGEFKVCRLATAAQPVDSNNSPATSVAGTTPLTPLL